MRKSGQRTEYNLPAGMAGLLAWVLEDYQRKASTALADLHCPQAPEYGA